MASEKDLEKARDTGRNGGFMNEHGLNHQERNALVNARNEGETKRK